MTLSATLIQKDYEIFQLTESSPENDVWSCDCYVVKSDNSAIIIDPGYTKFDEARNLLSEIGVNRGIILLTHGHWDHYYGAFDLLSNGFSEMYVHKDDLKYIDDLVDLIKKGKSTPETVKALSENLSALHGNKLNLKLDFLPANPAKLNGFEDKINYFDVDNFLFEYGSILYSCQHDGSHTKGHVTYQIGKVLFAGDLVLLKNGKLQIEPRLDHKETGIVRGIREVRDATKTALKRVTKNKDMVDYIALGHGGFIKIDEFIEKARRLIR